VRILNHLFFFSRNWTLLIFKKVNKAIIRKKDEGRINYRDAKWRERLRS
jgi:hypothetical protein